MALSLYPGVAPPVKAPKALYDGLRAVLSFLCGEKKKAAGWEYAVNSSLKKGEGIGFGDLCV